MIWHDWLVFFLQFDLLRTWTKSTHAYFPKSFKDAIRCLLLVHGTSWKKWGLHIDSESPAALSASNRPIDNAAPLSFALLPPDVLYIICRFAAFPIHLWAGQECLPTDTPAWRHIYACSGLITRLYCNMHVFTYQSIANLAPSSSLADRAGRSWLYVSI